MSLKIVAISDTHGYHRRVKLPEGDMLVHCGDITMKGEWNIYEDFLNWMKEQATSFKHRVVICGNHDFKHEKFASLAPEYGIIYLENSGVEIEGLKFWGIPNVSGLPRWNFDDSSDPLCWDKIPGDTEVLISHTPMYNVLDESYHYGSHALKERISDLMERKLKANIFGHCHADGGKQIMINSYSGNKVIFANASTCDIMYFPTNPAVVVDI